MFLRKSLKKRQPLWMASTDVMSCALLATGVVLIAQVPGQRLPLCGTGLARFARPMGLFFALGADQHAHLATFKLGWLLNRRQFGQIGFEFLQLL